MGVSLFTCRAGFEPLLAREVARAGLAVAAGGRGWLCTDAGPPADAPDWCFAHAVCFDAVEVRAASLNALAQAVADRFRSSARGERFDAPWPLVVFAAADAEGLGRRAANAQAVLRALLEQRMARVARLASADPPRSGRARGLFAALVDFGRAYVGREAWFGGQRRMADVASAPSRSYLKIEEAYGLLGREPVRGETVVDLGAAPGGWSYSAARRGARVIAVDNGPLKGAARGHPGIEPLRADAFRFRPRRGETYDWLFCDLVEDPRRVMRGILAPWIERAWCRRFVVNLKFGRADPLALLGDVRAGLAPRCARLVVRHLFHDREEFTVAGQTAGRSVTCRS